MTKLLNYMISNNLIPAEDKALYSYGLKQGAIMLLNIATTLIIGAALGMIWQSVLFTCAYIPLRSYAGGYHARTQRGCYFISTVLVFLVLLGMRYAPTSGMLFFGILSFASAVIYRLAPLADDNKPLDASEFQLYKSHSQKILFFELVLCALLFFLHLKAAAFCIVASLTLQGFMLALHKLLHQFKA